MSVDKWEQLFRNIMIALLGFTGWGLLYGWWSVDNFSVAVGIVVLAMSFVGALIESEIARLRKAMTGGGE